MKGVFLLKCLRTNVCMLTTFFLFLFPFLSSGQNSTEKSVAGIITDEAKQPLHGATIINLRTKKASSSNTEGKFSIGVTQGDKLEISYVGKINSTVFLLGKVTGEDKYQQK